MNLTPEEIEKIKKMFLFLIKKKDQETNGGGFHLHELNPILEKMAEDGEIEKRPTINHNKYFLKPN